jgi:UDP-glucose 4-epimerase
MEKKRALVTGGAGFIGSTLAKLLIEEGYDVTIWDDLSTGKKSNVPKGAAFKKIDIVESELPDFEVDHVFHLAAPISVQESLEDPQKYLKGCYQGTLRMMRWAEKNGIQTFQMASTAAVYGEPEEIPTTEGAKTAPMSPYAEGKLKAEKVLVSFQDKMTCTALRLFNVFGEGQNSTGSYAPAVARFMDQVKRGNPITVTGDGTQTRDYIYVGDVCRAFLAASKREGGFLVANVATGSETTVIDIAKAFEGHPIEFIEKRKEPMRSCADISKIKGALGWEPSTNILWWIASKRKS